MPVASAVAQQEISQQQSLTLMRNMMRLYLSNVCHGQAQQKRPTRAAGRR